jgi:hypothetical protein
MRYKGPDGETVRGEAWAVAKYADICRRQAHRKREWVEMLRSQGVKAAHPDDGWVDRENNVVTFVYPHFDDGVSVGDRIVLGWESRDWRYVDVVEVMPKRWSTDNARRYRFVDVDPRDEWPWWKRALSVVFGVALSIADRSILLAT